MVIKRRYLKHGDIVEIQLIHSKKFVYGKIVNPLKINNPIKLPFFLRVYKSVHNSELSDLNCLTRELLLAPFYLIGQSAAVTKFGWKIIGTENVLEEEEFIPDTKREWPMYPLKPEKWGYIKNFDTKVIFSDYDKVKHLDDSSGKNIEIIPFLIELEIMKLQGKDIKSEFGIRDWLEEHYYEKQSKLPIYSNLPNELKGKVAE